MPQPIARNATVNVVSNQTQQRLPSNPIQRFPSQPILPQAAKPSWSASQATPIGVPTNRPPPPRPAHLIEIPDDDDDDRDGEKVRVPTFNDVGGDLSQAEAEKALRELMSGAITEDVEIDAEDAIVPGLKDGFRLLPHQIQGRNWMRGREDIKGKRYGGILADDMGLGKTIQTLVRIVEGKAKKADREAGWSGSTLVVVPLAVMHQWVEEAKRMTDLKVTSHHGPSRTADPLELKRHHIVVTTYDVIKSEYAAFKPEAKNESKKSKLKASKQDSDSEAEHFGKTLSKDKPKRAGKVKKATMEVKWWRVVLDEAHNIKNRSTKAAEACFGLEARFKWCLTGTPMQNDVLELYSLLKFLHIKPFCDFERFNSEIAKPVKTGRGVNRAMKKLQVVLKSVMLRRLKDQMIDGKVLIELPPRQLDVISCVFSSKEQAFYNDLAAKMESTLENLMATEGKKNYISVLLLLLRLRQACDHCVLVSQDFTDVSEAVEPKEANKDADGQETGDGDDLIAAFGQLTVGRKCRICVIDLNSSNMASGKWDTHCIDCAEIAQQATEAGSTKIRKTMELLDDIERESEGEDKTIIFSQFTTMLDLIEPFLTKKGIRYARYDGSLKPAEREAALNKIKKDPKTKVILISFKAGSTGLNLTVCNRVILFDMWWNPALEDQAFDRAHRFGQTKKVTIYKLKVDDTVEDRILALQDKKRELTKAALSGDKVKNLRLDMNELLALFNRGGDDDDD
ncbi:SNF2 family N-terminal domain-containing protein [Mucidula mucida]|nr:SNF2 family N-terminal domain-containing protein [Mucidula mucida]